MKTLKRFVYRHINLKIYLIIFIIILIGNFSQTILANSSNLSSENTVDVILNKAREGVSKNAKVAELKSLSLEFNTKRVFVGQGGEKRQADVDTNIFASFPDKARIEQFSDYSTNQQLFTQILNVNQYSEDSQTLIGGKPFNFQSNLENLRPKITKDQQVDTFKRNIFLIFFPIIFQSSLYEGVEFKYIGEAEVNGTKTDVIEAADKTKPICRLFFDKKNGLPIFMDETLLNPFTNKEEKRKTTYSDYREEEGILIAHKIISQRGETLTEEHKLKKLDITPKFKSNLFEVKEK